MKMQNLDLFPELLPKAQQKVLKHAKAKLGGAAPAPSGQVDPIVLERTVFNEDRTHRFTLFRHWGDIDDYVCSISMNPSGASEDASDRTIDGMCKRARDYWGAGALYQLNAMSVRCTDSNDLKRAQIVNLPENDDWIRRIAAKARFVVVGWGNAGEMHGRGQAVAAILRNVCGPEKVFCFGRTNGGAPIHPLYQRLDAPLKPFFED